MGKQKARPRDGRGGEIMIRHLSFCVQGALNACDADLNRLAKSFTVDGVRLKTADELKAFLRDELAQGHEMLPMSDECDNHDWKTGCMGHPSLAGGMSSAGEEASRWKG